MPTQGILFDAKDARNVIAVINSQIFPKEVIYKTAYSFIDNFFVLLDKDKLGNILVKLRKKEGKCDRDIIEGEFHNELLNQLIRLQVYEQTKNLREMIVMKALFEAGRYDSSKHGEFKNFDLTKYPADENFQIDVHKIGLAWKKSHFKGDL